MNLFWVEGIGELGKIKDMYRRLHVAKDESDAIKQAKELMEVKGYSFMGRAVLIDNIDGYKICVRKENQT